MESNEVETSALDSPSHATAAWLRLPVKRAAARRAGAVKAFGLLFMKYIAFR